jgi:pimeloyl-ACP methyl ester carboxylesterase
MAPGLLQEPLGVRWQAALGMAKPAELRKGNAPCLLASPGKKPLIPVKRLVCLARTMQAEIVRLPQSGHHLWQDPALILELVKKLAARL